MELSIILPAYNEEQRIERGVEDVLSFVAEHGIDGEVLVVDDGSTDATPRLLAELRARHPELRVETLERNTGKGAAVRRGVQAARGDVVLFTDVDQSTPMSEWPHLAEALDHGYAVALASREVVGANREVPQPALRRAMGYVFMVLRDWLVLPGFIDTQCGFKAFRADVAREVFSRARLDGFCFDVEVLAIAVHRGHRVIEVPVKWRDDPRSKVSPMADSLDMFRDLFRIRANRRRGLYD